MDFPLWLFLCALSSALPTAIHCQCKDPGPGLCNKNNSQYINDRKVYSLAALNCPFQGNLCSYRQGCRDDDMTRWKAGNGVACARQKEVGCGANAYSVLESQWIDFNTPVCLHIKFSRFSPQALGVFVENYTGGDRMRTLFDHSHNTVYGGKIQTENCTIDTTIGKLLFRIFGGAPNVTKKQYLKLHPVTFQRGRCQTPDCSFTGSDEHSFCGWTVDGWNWTNNGRIKVMAIGDAATLTSPLTRATGKDSKDCLTFKFKLTAAEASLTVEVKVSGETTTIWSAFNVTSDKWDNASIQIVTFEAYQIIFSGQRLNSSDKVMVREVVVIPRTSEACVTEPAAAAVNVTWPLGKYTTSSPSYGPSYGPSTDGTDAVPKDSAAVADDSDAASEAGIIAGAVVAVLFVIAIVVGGVFFYRRRLQRNSEHESKDKERPNVKAGIQEQGHKEPIDGDYTEIRDSQIIHPPPEDDYTDIDESRFRASSPGDDVNPYDLGEDDAERTAATRGGDGYSHLNNEALPKPSAYGKLPKPADEGDYNRIGDSRQIPTAVVSSSDDDYNHISGSHSCQPAGNRNHRSGAGGTTPQRDPGYELARVVTPNESGSQTEDGRASEEGASTTPQDEGDYSTIAVGNRARERSQEQRSQTGEASFPESTNRPRAYKSSGQSVAAHGEGSDQTESTDDDYSLQKPVQELPDEYNSLRFDGTREDPAQSDKHAAVHAPYDHVRCDTDGDYNKTQVGKRNVVVDFDYDHVKH